MSKNIENAMYYSWMSQASYLNLANTLPLNEALQKKTGFADDKIFSEGQAKTFVEHHDFVHHLPNTNYGTSATVFKSKDNGSYTIAVRGTEPPSAGDENWLDALEDLHGVVVEGKAKVQVIQSFHYYKQLTTAQGEAICLY